MSNLDDYRWSVRCRNKTTGGLRTWRHAPRMFHAGTVTGAAFVIVCLNVNEGTPAWGAPVLLFLLVMFVVLMFSALFDLVDTYVNQ